MGTTMRAVVLDGPGPPSALLIKRIPVPRPGKGQVLVKVMAFGINRSEYHSRKGLAEGMTWPRVLGLEAVGLVEDAPGGEFARGQQVAALMGGMGRLFDGGYAEFCCVPVSCCQSFSSGLPWEVLGGIPEALQTAAGSLATLCLAKGDTLLIRGGTSTIGLFVASIAKSRGITVFSTTRSASRFDVLLAINVDHPLVDDGNIAEAVMKIRSNGVDGALELVGTNTLKDTIRATRYGATTCFTGMLSDQWIIKDFYPMDLLPNGRLTAYGGGSTDLPAATLQEYLTAVEAGSAKVPIGRTYRRLEDIVEAHNLMEEGKAGGKIVISLSEEADK